MYADSVYDALSQAEDEVSRIAALMFTKSETHAAMREYRFRDPPGDPGWAVAVPSPVGYRPLPSFPEPLPTHRKLCYIPSTLPRWVPVRAFWVHLSRTARVE